MKKIIMICVVIVSFPGLVHDTAHGADSNLPDDFPEFIITQNGETAPGYVIGSVISWTRPGQSLRIRSEFTGGLSGTHHHENRGCGTRSLDWQYRKERGL